jgi:hypothetical protein
MLTTREIELAANEVRGAFSIRSVPVDPIAIANAESIVLLPGDYDNCFDGRIEFRGNGPTGRFYLLYAQEQPGLRPYSRVRFSLAHELGHYYLPEHREYLLTGHRHGSKAGFVSEKPMEREADIFAAHLLMPTDFFSEHVARMSGRVCNLRNLSNLADVVFKTSLISTVIRYVQLDFEPCAAVVSRNSAVLYSVCSESFRIRGLGYMPKGSRLPSSSVTTKAVGASEVGRTPEFGAAISSGEWYSSRRAQELWEECRILGETGLVITLLATYNPNF